MRIRRRFTGQVQRLARVHHYGLRDKVNRLGTEVKYAIAIKGNRNTTLSGDSKSSIAGNVADEVAGDLLEKIGGIRSSVAAAQQKVIAPAVWVGSQEINVMQLMLDTLDVVRQLAEQTASYSHPSTGTPTNADAIRQTGTSASSLKQKYDPVIG